MVQRTTYCPAHDREVPVLLRKSAFAGGLRPRHATGAFLCLDYRVRCTGAMCPLMALPGTPAERAAHREAVKRFHGCSPLPLHGGSHPRLEDPRS